MIPRLIYSLSLPDDQAGGVPGSLVDRMVDLSGNFYVADGVLLNVSSDYSGKNWLAVPVTGSDPTTGEAYATGGQCVVARWSAVSLDSLTVGFHLWFEGSNPSDTDLQHSLYCNFDPRNSVFSAGQTGVGNTIAYDGTPASVVYSESHEYVCIFAVEQIDAVTINVYMDIRLASEPGTIIKKMASLGATVPGAEFTSGSVAIGARSSAGPRLSGFDYYRYSGAISAGPATATDLPPIGGSLAISPPVVSLVSPVSLPNSIGSVTQTSAAFSATGATGGDGAFTYQWVAGDWGQQPATMTPVGSPQVGLVSGAVPAGLTLSSQPGTLGAVALSVTDGSTTVYSPVAQFRTHTNPDLCILFIGDSIGQIENSWQDTTGGVSVATTRTPIDDVVEFLQTMLDCRILYINACQSGAKSYDWRDLSTSYLSSAVASLNALATSAGYSGTKYAVGMLGANDCLFSTPSETYKTHVRTRIQALTGLGFVCIEHYPSYASDGSNAGLNNPGTIDLLLNQYPQTLEELAAEPDGPKLGDTSRATQGAFANNTGNQWQRDGLHPLAIGAFHLARAQSEGIARVISSAGSGPSGDVDDMTAQEIIDAILGGVAGTVLADPANKIVSDAQGRVGLASGAISTDTFTAGATVPRVTLVDTCTTNADLLTPDGGTVAATPAPTTTTFKATGSGLHGSSGHYTAGSFTMFLVFTSGGNSGKAAKITAHSVAGSVHSFTVSTLPVTPAAGDQFLILGGLPS